MKRQMGFRLLLCAAAVLLSSGLRPVPAAAYDSGEPDVVVQTAELGSQWGVEGESSVSVLGTDQIQLALGTLTQPGAYAEVILTVENRGTEDAVLDRYSTSVDGDELFLVDFPELDADGGEVLAAGETCQLTLVVSWDADQRQSLPECVTGAFTLSLHYIYAPMETAVPSEPEPSAPQTPVGAGNGTPHVTAASVRTGDETALALWYLLLVTSAGALLLLVSRSRKR